MKYKNGELQLDKIDNMEDRLDAVDLLLDQDVTEGSSPSFSTENMLFAEDTPVNAEAESGVLTFSAPAIHGETITIGVDTYELLADTAQELSDESYHPVDITPYVTMSQGTLTIGAQPTVGDEMVVGSVTYTFVANDSTPIAGDILVGGETTPLLDAHANIVAAIAGTDGVNTKNADVEVTAFSGNDLVITARIGGVAGNLIATTATFTDGVSNYFDATELGTTTPGTDCTGENAATAIDAAITLYDTEGVSTSISMPDMTFTKIVAGNFGTATLSTMTGATFASATMTGGVDGTVGAKGEHRFDSGFLYIAIDTNTSADANWRKIALATF